MIFVKIELWPVGSRACARTLGEIIIHNTGGDHRTGEYSYLISKVGGFKATDEQVGRTEVKNVLRRGLVGNFPRLRLYATDLLLRVLASAFCARNVTPEVAAYANGKAEDAPLQSDWDGSGK